MSEVGFEVPPCGEEWHHLVCLRVYGFGVTLAGGVQMEAVELPMGHYIVHLGLNFDLASFCGLQANHPYEVPVHVLHARGGSGSFFATRAWPGA